MTVLDAPLSEDPIQFQSAAEFALLVGYEPALTCTKDQLALIVGKYSWDEPRALRCGLNGCNRVHWNGWVIATHDGRKTHCGVDCGEREFDVKFEEVRATFRRAEARAARAAVLADAVRQRDEYLSRAASLEASGLKKAAAVQAILTELQREQPLMRALQDALRNGGTIRREVKMDRDLLQAMGQRTDKVNLETVAVVTGGDAVHLHEKAVYRLRSKTIWPLRELTPESLQGLSDKALEAKAREIGQARAGLQEIEAFLDAATLFLSDRNRAVLAALVEAIPPAARNQRVKRIVARLSNTDDRPAP